MTIAATRTDMELPGWTLPEFEAMASLPKKTSYREVKLGRVEAYRDSQGRMRISPFEAYAYIKNRDRK